MQIFISHSSRDKPFVRRLCAELVARGLRTWVDEAEIRVGHSIPEQIGVALDASEVLCFILSRSSATSAWARRELNSFMPRMIEKGGVVLPCRVDEVPLPPLLADVKYADFSQSFDEGLTQLLAGVRLKEMLEWQAAVQQAAGLVEESLSTGELAFFVHRFQRSAHYFIADRRDTPAPWGVLRKLQKLGVLERDADKYEVLFALTEKGADVLRAVIPLVPEEVLRQLDVGEGARNAKPSP